MDERYKPYVKRVVCWFSCGATSAVAAKLAIKRYGNDYPVVVAYCDTGSEHPDNERFMRDCEEWFGCEVLTLKHPKHEDIWDVFESRRYIVGPGGAPCTMLLKRDVRGVFESPNEDLQVWGFDGGELERVENFKVNNPEVMLDCPLIDDGLSKAHCLSILGGVGIEIPAMYRLGYNNSNCLGCVKGQQWYWNKVRHDFPDVFARMAKLEREIGAAINKSYAGDGKRKRVFLDELDPEAGRESPDVMSCDLFCSSEAEEVAKDLE